MDHIKSYDEFVNESLFSDVVSRGEGNALRSEVKGKIIAKTSKGICIVSNDCDVDETMNPVKFGDDYLYTIDELGASIICLNKDNTDRFFIYDSSIGPEEINTWEMFETSKDFREKKNGLNLLKALVRMGDDVDIESLKDSSFVSHPAYCIEFDLSDNTEYYVFDSEESAQNYAVEDCRDLLDESSIITDSTEIQRFYDLFGDDILNVSDMEDVLRESYESYYDEMSEEDAIDELLARKIIEDTEEYFELDEDGETDHDLPKFEYIDYEEDYVNSIMKGVHDVVDEYISNFGTDGIGEYLCLDKLAEKIIEADGRGPTIASEDGKEREDYFDGDSYFVYRIS